MSTSEQMTDVLVSSSGVDVGNVEEQTNNGRPYIDFKNRNSFILNIITANVFSTSSIKKTLKHPSTRERVATFFTKEGLGERFAVAIYVDERPNFAPI